jgi:hypothetical protein
MAKVTGSQTKIASLCRKIEKTEAKRNEAWHRCDLKALDEQDRIKEEEIRPLDALINSFFSQLWDEYKKSSEKPELVGKEKDPVTQKWKRFYCDGVLHVTTDKNDTFMYGWFCNCDA